MNQSYAADDTVSHLSEWTNELKELNEAEDTDEVIEERIKLKTLLKHTVFQLHDNLKVNTSYFLERVCMRNLIVSLPKDVIQTKKYFDLFFLNFVFSKTFDSRPFEYIFFID